MRQTLLCGLLLLLVGTVNAQDLVNKGKIALGARDTLAAVRAFQDALAAGQKTAEANYYLGSIAYAQGRIDDAITYLVAAHKADDEQVDVLRLLGELYLHKREYAAAANAFRLALKISPKDGGIATGYGRALVAIDSIDAAIIQLTRAKDFAPESPGIYDALGDAYIKQGVIPLGIMNYQRSLELSPGSVGTRAKLAKAFERQRQYNEAVREYQAITDLDSTYADAYLQQGRILVLAKQFKRAVSPLRRFVALQPTSAEGVTLFARALFGSEEWREAADAAKKSLAMDSSSVDVWRILAHSYVELKDFTGAKGAFGELDRRKAIKSEDQVKLGKMYFGLGQKEEAQKAYEAALVADSTNCDPYFDLGFLYMSKQDYSRAAAMFEKKIACDPRSLSSYLNAGACYMQLKNYPRARELFITTITLKPDFYQGRLWLARYYTQVDSLDFAKGQYDEVLALIGDQPDKKKEAGEAHSLLGSYYFIRQQFARAVESYRKAMTLGYDNASVRLSYGQAVLQTLDRTGDAEENKRKIEESIRAFRKCVELEPNNAQGHLWLGQALILSRVEGDDEGNRKLSEEACGEFRKVLKLDPKNEDAKKSMARIGCQ